MDPWTALGYILLGGLLGAIGQGIRVVVGLKKQMDESSKSSDGSDGAQSKKDWQQWFDPQQLLVSLAIAFVVGGIAGTLASLQSFGQDVTKEYMISIITVGYAGTDFVEGFMKTK
jgi:hypothetical protein